MEFQQFREREDVEGEEEGRGMGSMRRGGDDSNSLSLQLCNLRNISCRGGSKDIRAIKKMTVKE
jgi:hypothetical protein